MCMHTGDTLRLIHVLSGVQFLCEFMRVRARTHACASMWLFTHIRTCALLFPQSARLEDERRTWRFLCNVFLLHEHGDATWSSEWQSLSALL